MKRLAIGVAILFVLPALAERKPQLRDEATVVVKAEVEKITTRESKFGADGVRTDYTAKLAVLEVDKGAVKAGDRIEVTWYDVTKRPSKLLPGAYGQDHGLKEKDVARFWLMGAKSPYTVIYNRDGVAKEKK